MKNKERDTYCGSLILAGLMVVGLSGCDYWPPALLAQLEQLRNHIQDVSDDRAELEIQLREATILHEELRVQVDDLSLENRKLRQKIARLQRNPGRQTSKQLMTTPSSRARRAGATSSTGMGTRALAVKKPLMRGQDVKAVQRGLSQAGISVKDDGFYGVDTKNAVKAFQRGHGLRADGVVGPGTRTALSRDLSRAQSPRVVRLEEPHMQGGDVKKIQKALRHAGVAVHIDGTFGAKTESAVKRFQRKQGLRADGVVGPATREALGLS
jgi:peptidoglycan hydrolase-like protein with peptidoglycan-binding domain